MDSAIPGQVGSTQKAVLLSVVPALAPLGMTLTCTPNKPFHPSLVLVSVLSQQQNAN